MNFIRSVCYTALHAIRFVITSLVIFEMCLREFSAKVADETYLLAIDSINPRACLNRLNSSSLSRSSLYSLDL